ncbi:unnamed protein product [Candidula unifasciata]|uniref:Uncharacterized protein n=1 Tax=Candidula unifasciata TaxID=100452 RepID=A0A8S3Z4V4_9EUPU|nr:unnamed protein product [Candidula unifasciata]
MPTDISTSHVVNLENKRYLANLCQLSDITANDGEIFVTSLTGPCVKYFCNDSNILPNEYGCERDGKCFPLGDTYGVGCFRENILVAYILGCEFKSTCLSVNDTTSAGCQKYQCTKEGDSWTATYSLQVIEWGCAYQNRCVSEGESVPSGCNKFQCVRTVNNGETTLTMEFVQGGCERNGKCYPVGDSFTSGCIQRTCTLENGRIGYSLTSEGCMSRNSTCVNVGEILLDGCTSYLCVKIVDTTLTTYSLDIHEEKCEDLNHQCRTPGSFFPYEISGVLKPNCTCTVLPVSGIGYSCF